MTLDTSHNLRLRLALLIGQSLGLGLTLAFLFVTAIALFLSFYGASTLPYVYIVVAVLGSAVFYGFFGQYTFFLNLADILFLALLAGFLLNRFGLQYGLVANPVVVVLLLAAIVTVGLVAGPAVPLFFWLVVVARPTDIVLTDGTTRTSINAAYQALPGQERVVVQTAVEGIGVPVALGLTGVLLLIFDAIPGTNLIHIAAFTLLTSLLWTWTGLLVYRHYGANLRQTMRRRTIDPVALTLDDASSLAVVERFLHGDRIDDVCLGLDLLENTGHTRLPHLEPSARLREIIIDPDAVWQNPWLSACALYAAGMAGLGDLADVAELCLDHEDESVRETSTWALAQQRSKA